MISYIARFEITPKPSRWSFFGILKDKAPWVQEERLTAFHEDESAKKHAEDLAYIWTHSSPLLLEVKLVGLIRVTESRVQII